MPLADILDNCVFNTNLASDPVRPMYGGVYAGQNVVQVASTQVRAEHPFVDVISRRMQATDTQLRTEELQKMLDNERATIERFRVELDAERGRSAALAQEVGELGKRLRESEAAAKRRETELVQQAREGQDCVLQLNIVKERALQLQKELRQESELTKRQAAQIQRLTQFIQENTPALRGDKPKKRVTREEKAGKAIVEIEAETQARAREVLDVLAKAKEDVNVLEDYDVVEALKQVKARRVQARDLSRYRRGVHKLGVVVK